MNDYPAPFEGRVIFRMNDYPAPFEGRVIFRMNDYPALIEGRVLHIGLLCIGLVSFNISVFLLHQKLLVACHLSGTCIMSFCFRLA